MMKWLLLMIPVATFAVATVGLRAWQWHDLPDCALSPWSPPSCMGDNCVQGRVQGASRPSFWEYTLLGRSRHEKECAAPREAPARFEKQFDSNGKPTREWLEWDRQYWAQMNSMGKACDALAPVIRIGGARVVDTAFGITTYCNFEPPLRDHK